MNGKSCLTVLQKESFNGGYTIVAGLEHLQQFVENFRFDEEDIDYLESLHIFYPAFLDYLKDFRFKGNIYAVPEGTVVFPANLFFVSTVLRQKPCFLKRVYP